MRHFRELWDDRTDEEAEVDNMRESSASVCGGAYTKMFLNEKDLNPSPAIKKYRKKPVVVTAYQAQKELIIPTLEGDMKANPGDYIITGVNGEQYPCKPDIFDKTYEPIENDVE